MTDSTFRAVGYRTGFYFIPFFALTKFQFRSFSVSLSCSIFMISSTTNWIRPPFLSFLYVSYKIYADAFLWLKRNASKKKEKKNKRREKEINEKLFRLIIGQISVVCVCVCVFSSFAIDSRSFFYLFSSSCCSCIFESFSAAYRTRYICIFRHVFATAVDETLPVKIASFLCARASILVPPLLSLYLLLYIYNFCLFPFMLVFGLKKQQQNVKKQTEKKCVHFFKRINDKVLCRRLFLLLP